jgi:hypothetical protein
MQNSAKCTDKYYIEYIYCPVKTDLDFAHIANFSMYKNWHWYTDMDADWHHIKHQKRLMVVG